MKILFRIFFCLLSLSSIQAQTPQKEKPQKEKHTTSKNPTSGNQIGHVEKSASGFQGFQKLFLEVVVLGIFCCACIILTLKYGPTVKAKCVERMNELQQRVDALKQEL